MKILLDHCVPRPLRNHFSGHEVHTAYERGWAEFKNGALLSAAESEEFAVLVTIDQNVRFQQNMKGREIAVVILASASNRTLDLLPLLPSALRVLDSIGVGEVIVVNPPDAS